MKIAIDGTAGSGKGTLSERLSKKLCIPYLDTGLLYRKVAYDYLTKFEFKSNFQLNKKNLMDLLNHSDFKDLNSTELKKDKYGLFASRLAKIPELRNRLNILQIEFIDIMLKKNGGCILDGRDIGTQIMPDAEFKFFIVASVKSRTDRRFKELQYDDLPKQEQLIMYKELFNRIELRDNSDYNRKISPLKKAFDAFEIDTTKLTPQQVESIALKHISKQII